MKVSVKVLLNNSVEGNFQEQSEPIYIDLAPRIFAITSLNLVQFHDVKHYTASSFSYNLLVAHKGRLTSPKIAICPISKYRACTNVGMQNVLSGSLEYQRRAAFYVLSQY